LYQKLSKNCARVGADRMCPRLTWEISPFPRLSMLFRCYRSAWEEKKASKSKGIRGLLDKLEFPKIYFKNI